MTTRYFGPVRPGIREVVRVELSQVAWDNRIFGETVNQYETVYFDGTLIRKADASNPVKMPATGIAQDTVTGGKYGDVWIRGIVSNGNWSFASGSTVFVGSGGNLVDSPPSISGDIVQRMGRAMTITQIDLDPDPETLQIGV